MSERPTRRLAGIALALTLLAAGCSDEGTSDGVQMVTADAQPYVDALAAGLAEDGDQVVTIDDEEATCIAEQWVEVLDPERLDAEEVDPASLERGLAALDLDLADGRELFGAYETCEVDVRERLTTVIATDDELTGPQRDCLDEVLTDDYVEELVATSIVHGGLRDGDLDPAEVAELTGPLASCQDPGA